MKTAADALAELLIGSWVGQPIEFPAPTIVHDLVEACLDLLFPHFAVRKPQMEAEVYAAISETTKAATRCIATSRSHLAESPEALSEKFIGQFSIIFETLMMDAQAIVEGDPAAKSLDEVIIAYPGFRAVATYRLAHALYGLGVPLIPRMMTEYAHQRTGIDIHPGARIGRSFCIDHGTGLVIGETTEIGDNVKLYQGVTLGALSVKKRDCDRKRHPTLESGVVVYSNATILGGSTTIGRNSVIGGNVWLTESVPPYSRVYHESAITVKTDSAAPE